MGNKNGIVVASNNGIIEPWKKVFWHVPGKFPIIYPDQDHTALQIKFRDGKTIYIDCKTISTLDVNQIGKGESFFSLPCQVPVNWKEY